MKRTITVALFFIFIGIFSITFAQDIKESLFKEAAARLEGSELFSKQHYRNSQESILKFIQMEKTICYIHQNTKRR